MEVEQRISKFGMKLEKAKTFGEKELERRRSVETARERARQMERADCASS